ncbi:putative L-asparaginase [Penicillium digitatum]|nr:hypothetical protein PDIDSM_1651 [Penicillium digitatum]QQK47994.1 putative L-asparaginase [Penicillium digitatum]
MEKLSKAVCHVTGSKHCGLVSNGDNSVTLLPFPKLQVIGAEIPSDELEYYPVYPGYLSSKNGPKMTSEFLSDVSGKVTAVTGIAPDGQFDKTFFGEAADQDLMARLIRGDLPQHRIWEDAGHAAMISPKGKVPGYTIVVPRAHLAPDLLNLPDEEYDSLIAASHATARALMLGLGVARCGMFFEGFEGHYAHTKIIPIHEPSPSQQLDIAVRGPAPYSEDYQGYMTTQLGPTVKDEAALIVLVEKIRAEVDALKI